MFILYLFISFLVLFSFQTTVLAHFSIAGVTPDLVLIMVVYYGINLRGNNGIGLGFVVGLVQDCLSGGLLGVNTLSKSMIGLFFSTLKDKILVEGVLPISVFIIAASILDGLVYYFVMISLLKGNLAGTFIFSEIPLFSFYNAAAGIFLFYLFDLNRKWVLRKIPNHLFRPL